MDNTDLKMVEYLKEQIKKEFHDQWKLEWELNEKKKLKRELSKKLEAKYKEIAIRDKLSYEDYYQKKAERAYKQRYNEVREWELRIQKNILTRQMDRQNLLKIKHEMDHIDTDRYQAFKIIKEEKNYSWRKLHEIYAPDENFSTFYLKCKNIKSDPFFTGLEYYDRPFLGKKVILLSKRRKRGVLSIKQGYQNQIDEINTKLEELRANKIRIS